MSRPKRPKRYTGYDHLNPKCQMCGVELPKHAPTCAYTEFKTVLPDVPIVTSPPRTEKEQISLKVKWGTATEEWTTSIANDFARRIDEDVMRSLANALDDSWCA